VTIDRNPMDAAKMLPWELVDICGIANGSRAKEISYN
jgi:aspartate 1-decarboxylase